MNIHSLLDYLEAELGKGSSMPLTSRVLVDREKCLEILEEIRENLPEDIKEARYIVEQRNQLLYDAQQECDNMLSGAQEKLNAIINDHEITQGAYAQAEQILANAQQNAQEVQMGAKVYADDVLAQLQNFLDKELEDVVHNREGLRQE
ncbi:MULTISPECIES: ATPase [unclassified Clostridium]|uniref:ATPase n=1 Tax=unclassified Clostridium TaxID=2614128 RepID=UPI001106FCE6|nr:MULTISPECIES: ATPase [unclassified Clostridium]